MARFCERLVVVTPDLLCKSTPEGLQVTSRERHGSTKDTRRRTGKRKPMEQKNDPRDIFIRGTVVDLKVLSRDDVVNSNWYGWFNDEELCQTLQKHYFPNTLESQIQFWEKNILPSSTNSQPDKIQLGICRVGEPLLLGIVSLNNIDFINRKCEFSMVIGEKEGRNVKVFLEASRLIFRHAFETLNMNRIYGGSISKELVVLMCRSLGCKDEGVSRQDIFKNGKYHDSYRYSLLREDR